MACKLQKEVAENSDFFFLALFCYTCYNISVVVVCLYEGGAR